MFVSFLSPIVFFSLVNDLFAFSSFWSHELLV